MRAAPLAGLEPWTRVCTALARTAGRGRCLRRRYDIERAGFGAAFTAWRYDRGLTLPQAAARLGVSEQTERTWGLGRVPSAQHWEVLVQHGIDPQPYYRPARRAGRLPLEQRIAFGRALTAWMEQTRIDVATELDLSAEAVRNWARGLHAPTAANRSALIALGFAPPGESRRAA